MTNAEKFKEVFGVEPDEESMAIACPIDKDCKFQSEMGRCHCWDWWQEEYNGHDV